MTFRPSSIILVTLLLLLPTDSYAEEHFPGAIWEHVPDGSGGWSAATAAPASPRAFAAQRGESLTAHFKAANATSEGEYRFEQ